MAIFHIQKFFVDGARWGSNASWYTPPDCKCFYSALEWLTPYSAHNSQIHFIADATENTTLSRYYRVGPHEGDPRFLVSKVLTRPDRNG